ncbi:MAG: metal-dependent transcriptional regulator [Deltaproteobacteria bacterium]|nr:metal-dependent transcriptional regulator [Deltaproteobacteria bacterium]
MSQEKTGLSNSLEDYLEVILDLESKNKVARVKDIAEGMGVLQGSVTGALKKLGERGLINYEPYNYITLTREGKAIAREITRRHEIIREFLSGILQLDEEKAEINACRMEHSMDKDAVDRLVQFIDYVNKCPRTGMDWIESFKRYFSAKKYDRKECKNCLERSLKGIEGR